MGWPGRFISINRRPQTVAAAPVDGLQAMADDEPSEAHRHRDTTFDMGMARAAGASGIGAAWGYHDAQELTDRGAFAVAERPSDVLELVAEVWGEVDG